MHGGRLGFMGIPILVVRIRDEICFECLALKQSCHCVFWVILISCFRCKKREKGSLGLII